MVVDVYLLVLGTAWPDMREWPRTREFWDVTVCDFAEEVWLQNFTMAGSTSGALRDVEQALVAPATSWPEERAPSGKGIM